jgi:hypothetical protein
MVTRAVEDPIHAEKSYAQRNPRGLENARKTIGTLHEGASRTMDMNIREKSDMAIENAPNKREKPLAEVVEGSAVLKRNIQQFSAVRTSAGESRRLTCCVRGH